MVLAIKDLKVGGFSQPLPFTDERNKKGVRLIYLQSRSEPHRENLKEDYSKVASRALDEKKSEVLEKWFKSHIPNYYIQVDANFAGCETVKGLIGTAAVK
jgi:peptidyl-prolyl cis-trans isomerase SurA